MDKLTLTDDEKWIKEQGVPSFDQPFIQKYLQGRDALVEQEKKQRSGSFTINGVCLWGERPNIFSIKTMLSPKLCRPWRLRPVPLSLP